MLERALRAVRRLPPLALAVTLFAGVSACGDDAGDTIDRQIFIDTYVNLRTSALDTDSGRVATADRDAILAGHGVSEGDLTTFADAHASDLEFMRDVWNDIELALDSIPGGG